MGRHISNKRLKDYFAKENIMIFHYNGNKEWTISHDNEKLINTWNEFKFDFPKLKLKNIEEYSYQEFVDLLSDLTETWYSIGSFKHEYLNNSKNDIKNYFYNKYINENSTDKNKYWKLTEMNLWENEKWNTFIADTKENREILQYLNKKFEDIVIPKREYNYGFMGMKSLKPIAVSIFSIQPQPLDKEEVEEILNRNKNGYAKDDKINKLKFSINDIKDKTNNELFNEILYKNGIRTFSGKVNLNLDLNI